MSFSRELLNGPCKEPNKNTVEDINTMNEPKRTEGSESCADVFSSIDFGKFLSKDFPLTPDLCSHFLSKDYSVQTLDSSVFKSKDEFSKLFTSSDWGMKFQNEDAKTTAEELPPLKCMSSTLLPDAERKKALAKVFSSNEWMPMKTLGSHVDVAYSRDMFSGSDSEASVSELPVELPPAKTDWDDLFYSQLQLIPPSAPIGEPVGSLMVTPQEQLPPEVISGFPQQVAVAATTPEPIDSSKAPKKKRKRKPRKKVVPEGKVCHVEPADLDVLLGRGGRSNHHPGNKRYREEVKNLHTWYLGIEEKDEKTDLSQCLVNYVHSYKGRFLENDGDGWYVIPNIVARRKASQALREDNDPKKRAQKRARFLQKKAEKMTEKRQA